MSQRYEKMFSSLKKKGEGAFIPFVMLGDPGMKESRAVVETLIESGADALELGIPFSDPVADGPAIQAAANRALAGGAAPDACLEVLAQVREKYADIPAGLLVYANLAISKGGERFYQRAADSGADSILVADVPTLMAGPFVRYARDAGIDPVFIVPPNANDEKLREIAALTKGYTYFLGRAGVTGADREMKAPPSSKITLLKNAGAPPIVVGFGISRPEHVKASLEAGADGAISGSATAAIIAAHSDGAKTLRAELAAFVKKMKSATRF